VPHKLFKVLTRNLNHPKTKTSTTTTKPVTFVFRDHAHGAW